MRGNRRFKGMATYANVWTTVCLRLTIAMVTSQRATHAQIEIATGRRLAAILTTFVDLQHEWGLPGDEIVVNALR